MRGLLALLPLLLHPVPDQGPVVRAILFYSPTCPHCHEVMTQDLPPLLDRYGDSVVIAGVNTATSSGQRLYMAAIRHFGLSGQRLGVPMMVVGDQVLMGALEIPERFPGIVAEGLAAGGMGWPEVPLIRQALAAQGVPMDEPAAEPAVEAAPESPGLVALGDTATPTGLAGMAARFRRDPAGNGLSVVVLFLMAAALAVSVTAMVRMEPRLPDWPEWAVPALLVVGAAVAAYLSFVEVSHAEAVCGPVGDCNTVQQSPYAVVLGIPVGVAGLVGYAALAVAWILARVRGSWAGALALWGMALTGTLFSLYLTFLEPFVIGATCLWCLTSAVVITAILLAATPLARSALVERTHTER